MSVKRAILVPELVTLAGTSGSPIQATDSIPSPTNAQAGWRFNVDGTLERFRLNDGPPYDFRNQGVEWNNKDPGIDYWIRALNDAGDNPTSGPALNTWLALAGAGEAAREWLWLETGTSTTAGTLQIDIATDSGGSTIVATGFYRGFALVTL
ncbi:MAG: hypothetical protein V3S69_07595 [Dehalococcoidales bacterium]